VLFWTKILRTILALFLLLPLSLLFLPLLLFFLQSPIRMAQVPIGSNDVSHKRLESFDLCICITISYQINQGKQKKIGKRWKKESNGRGNFRLSCAYREIRRLASDPKEESLAS
jgi:hypothetical protein